MDIEAVLDRALRCHQLGNMEEAQALYGEVLRQAPNHADALHLFGVLHHQTGAHEEAAKLIRRAIKRQPREPAYHCNLGEALRGLGKHRDAEKCFRKALKLAPSFAAAAINLGNLRRDQGKLDRAIVQYKKALAMDPASYLAAFNLGGAHAETEQWTEAADAYRKAIGIMPESADAHAGLGNALAALEDMDGAINAYENALKFMLGDAALLNNLDNAWAANGDLGKATECLEQALAQEPDSPTLLCSMGDFLVAGGDLDGGADHFRRALRIDPEHLAAKSGMVNVHFFKGDWAAAWEENEIRWQIGNIADRPFPQPLWRGEPLSGETVLVWGEQGVGEEIQFASMVPDLLDKGASVILESDPRLVPLFERAFPSATCISRTTPPDPRALSEEVSYQTPSGSLGRWLRPDDGSFPDRLSYLAAGAERRGEFRDRYRQADDELLIGLAWHSRSAAVGRHKSMTLMECRPFLEAAKDARIVNLQYGDTSEERAAFESATGIGLIHDEAIDQFADLDGFAAQISAMDLVISVSNTTVHMAGALGVPTWALLSAAPFNRWMMDREDSPWYPSVRLFRQLRLNDWAPVAARIAEALAGFGPRES